MTYLLTSMAVLPALIAWFEAFQPGALPLGPDALWG